MSTNPPDFYVSNISRSGLSIYDPIEVGDPDLWVPTPELEFLLNRELTGLSLARLPLRTRSKIVKTAVCQSLGYPVPKSFKRTQPRFLGQMFDTYTQKSNNLQVWNEELAPTRRYVIIRVSSDDRIVKVKVVTGDALAKLDTTGTLTQKYQARLIRGKENAELVSSKDTDLVSELFTKGGESDLTRLKPTTNPSESSVLPIATVFERLRPMIGLRLEIADMIRNACEAETYINWFANTSATLIMLMMVNSPMCGISY